MKAKFFLQRIYFVALLTVTISGLASDHAISQKGESPSFSLDTETKQALGGDTDPNTGMPSSEQDGVEDSKKGSLQPVELNYPSGSKDIGDWLTEGLKEGGLIYGPITFVLSYFLLRAKRKFKKMISIEQNKIEAEKKKAEENIQRGLLSSEPLKSNEERNAIIIVGLGGSGKTTLINKLFG
ncbi:MAG: hypothetical protein F6K26_13395 [Moorea sp. SIO2I5]|nr:hypothetical protein [Moorena sp. SIO2I5]